MPSKRLMITAAQIRAARALLGWNRQKAGKGKWRGAFHHRRLRDGAHKQHA